MEKAVTELSVMDLSNLASLVGIDKETVQQAKQVMEMIKLILPKCEFRTVRVDDEKDLAAVLFPHTTENIKRVEAIEAIFTDILPPFQALPDFRVTDEDTMKDTLYAALLFEIPAQKDAQK